MHDHARREVEVSAVEHERADRSPAVGYVRGVAGGLIAGLPLLYTMEVWWLGESASAVHVLVMLVFATVPVGVLVLTAGFRADSDVSLTDVVVDTSTALLLGIVTCAVVLLVLQRLGPDTSLLAGIESVVVQAAPFALGAAIATHVFRPGSASADERDGRRRGPIGPTWATVRDLGATATGALFFGMAIAPTQEVPMIASSLEPSAAIVLVGLSLVSTYGIVFVADFADQQGRRGQEGVLQHPLTETVAAYVVTLVIAVGMLWIFDNLPAAGPMPVLLEAIVLGFPASVGGAAGRLAV